MKQTDTLMPSVCYYCGTEYKEDLTHMAGNRRLYVCKNPHHCRDQGVRDIMADATADKPNVVWLLRPKPRRRSYCQDLQSTKRALGHRLRRLGPALVSQGVLAPVDDHFGGRSSNLVPDLR